MIAAAVYDPSGGNKFHNILGTDAKSVSKPDGATMKPSGISLVWYTKGSFNLQVCGPVFITTNGFSKHGYLTCLSRSCEVLGHANIVDLEDTGSCAE